MHRGFGTILKQYLVGSTSAEQSQNAILLACNTYFSEVFNSHISIPCFNVAGAITTYAAGTTVPVTGPLGTISSFVFKPIDQRELNILLQNNFFYIGLTKAIEKMFFNSIISVDIKPIGALVPKTIVSGLLRPIALFDDFGEFFQDYMDSTRRATLEEWYATLDVVFENVWTFILGVTFEYVAIPVPEGVFNGTITFSGIMLGT